RPSRRPLSGHSALSGPVGVAAVHGLLLPALFELVGAVDGSAAGVEGTLVVDVLVDRVQRCGGAVPDAVQCCARQTLGLEFGPTQGVQFLVLVARVVA